MGYNTTVIILNDALGEIEKDPQFGKKLANACLAVIHRGQIDISAGFHGNAATVIETHHADSMVAVLVGSNRGQVLSPNCGEWRTDLQDVESKEKVLRELAGQNGFRLVRKW